MTLVAFDKVAMPFCSLLCKLGQERGIGECGVVDHTISPRMASAAWFNCFENCVTGESFTHCFL